MKRIFKIFAVLQLFFCLQAGAIDIVRRELGVDGLHSGQSLVLQSAGIENLRGSGVVVGIIDNGFDYQHPAFTTPGTGALRIARVWEQRTEAKEGQHAPEGFGYGIELATPEAILAAQGDIYSNSHGSHVTGIIAGSDTEQENRFWGLAPEAEIVLVSKADYRRNNADILDGIRYIADYARQQGKPCVINMSLGNHAGPHDGTSEFDRALADFEREGLVLVGSAGNHRADKFHLGADFASADDAPLQTCIDFRSTPSATNAQGDVEIWGRPGVDFRVELLCVSTRTASATETLVLYEGRGHENGAADTGAEGAQQHAFESNIKGEVLVASEIYEGNGCQHVVVSSRITNVRNNYAVGLRVVPLSAGRVDVWADNSYVGLDGKKLAGFSDADGEMTICEIGGTSNDIISVGAYATRTKYMLMGETYERSVQETEGALCSFSSQGPTADGRTKPEVTAPGCITLSAVSSFDQSGLVQTGHAYNVGDLYVRYGYMQGTSMAAPVVTGLVALMLQVCPTLSTASAKALLVGSSRDAIAKVDAEAAIALTLQHTGIDGVLADAPASSARYNLQGQRVGAGYRGISIVNGKKYIKN